MGSYMSYFESRPIVYLLQIDPDHNIMKNKNNFYEFINTYPELDILDQQEKKDLYDLVFSYKISYGWNIKPIDNYSNNSIDITDNYYFLWNIILKSWIDELDIKLLHRYLNILVNKLRFDVNIKNDLDMNILKIIINHLYFDLENFVSFSRTDLDDYVECIIEFWSKN